ncbi:hypothetical protein ATM97_02500 [Nocardia sp. MH4]|nr:hypothetical protein [Nocardia sp. MH4]
MVSVRAEQLQGDRQDARAGARRLLARHRDTLAPRPTGGQDLPAMTDRRAVPIEESPHDDHASTTCLASRPYGGRGRDGCLGRVDRSAHSPASTASRAAFARDERGSRATVRSRRRSVDALVPASNTILRPRHQRTRPMVVPPSAARAFRPESARTA